MKKDITELFVFLDDFCKAVNTHENQRLIEDKNHKNPTRSSSMTISEILTIMIMFHHSPCKNFKYFYLSHMQGYKAEFPKLLSYNRFVEIKQRCLPYLFILFQWFCNRTNPFGVHFIDSTFLAVCHNKRIFSHKVFKDFAQRGKSSMGWFFGFKLHLVINAHGEIQGAMLTPGNVDDREPVEQITHRLTGLLFGDRGYIKQELFEKLYERGLKMVTNLKSKMKNKLVAIEEKLMLRKRSISETVNDFLKNKLMLCHTRHRSVPNFMVHVASTLVAYCFKSAKPKVKFNDLIPN